MQADEAVRNLAAEIDELRREIAGAPWPYPYPYRDRYPYPYPHP